MFTSTGRIVRKPEKYQSYYKEPDLKKHLFKARQAKKQDEPEAVQASTETLDIRLSLYIFKFMYFIAFCKKVINI